MTDVYNWYYHTVYCILFSLKFFLSESKLKWASNGDFFNNTVIVAKTYILTPKTTLFQRYDSTLSRDISADFDDS